MQNWYRHCLSLQWVCWGWDCMWWQEAWKTDAFLLSSTLSPLSFSVSADCFKEQWRHRFGLMGWFFFGVFQGRNTFPIRLPSQHMASWLRIVFCWWIGFVSFSPTVLPQCMNWGEVTIVPLFCATFNYHILYFSCCCHFWIYINNGSICHILFRLRCSTETISWHTKNGPLMFALLDWNCACRNIFNISNTKD